MSETTLQKPIQTTIITPFIRTPNLVKALIHLRQELEQIAPLDKQFLYADQLLYDICLALELPQESIIEIIGKDIDPYHENIGGK